MTKIGFVDAGRIGSTSAFAILRSVDVDEIALRTHLDESYVA